jgi:hypothetical protein
MDSDGPSAPATDKDTSPEAEARLAKLESRVMSLERRIFESQVLIARKLVEIFTALKKQQELRDAHVQDTLARLLGEINVLKARLEPVVAPTTTH